MFAEQQRRAVEMRLAGATITEIAAATGRPKTTVWSWVRTLPLPPEQRTLLRTLSAVRGIAAQASEAAGRRRKQWLDEARSEWALLKNDSFFLFGLGLYWGEGNKVESTGGLRLSNADGNLLRSWSVWCRRYFPGKGMTASVTIHHDTDEQEARKFWSACLGLPIRIYAYPQRSKLRASHKKLPYGTGRLVIKKSLDALVKTKEWCRLVAIDFG